MRWLWSVEYREQGPIQTSALSYNDLKRLKGREETDNNTRLSIELQERRTGIVVAVFSGQWTSFSRTPLFLSDVGG